MPVFLFPGCCEPVRYPNYLLIQIRDTLADLYVGRGDILRVLADSGIPAHTVNLEQDAAAVWHETVNEADKLGSLHSLLKVALQQYPNYEPLLACQQALRDIATRAKSELPPRFANSEKNGAGSWIG